jgi:3-oxoacyl-[acyl-carrier protein] reductase
MQLQNKIAVVTGASRGIGAAIAKRLASDGATVVVNYKSNEEAAQAGRRRNRKRGRQSRRHRCRHRRCYGCAAHVLANRRRVGHVDILVNNAGWAEWRVLAEADEDHYDSIFDLNTRGLFFATQEAARIMRDNGRIINISSGITRVNSGVGSVYAGSKAAIEAFTRCWSEDLGKRGITVNTVSPGMVAHRFAAGQHAAGNAGSHGGPVAVWSPGRAARHRRCGGLFVHRRRALADGANILANGGVG